MGECPECIRLYQTYFLSRSAIETKLKDIKTLKNILGFVKLELINIQLFLEFSKNASSKRHLICHQCYQNTFDQNYKIFIGKLYTGL